MALDGIVCAGLRAELEARLANARVSRVYQAGSDVYIEWRQPGEDLMLSLSAHPQHARAHLTGRPVEPPPTPPAFCMLLRKHLMPGRLLRVEQTGLERILAFRIEGLDEGGRRAERLLVCELMGRHSNIILIDAKGVIIDALRRATAAVNVHREVMPGAPYVAPPAQAKQDLRTASPDWIARLVRHAAPDARWDRLLSDALFGIGPSAARALCLSAGIDPAGRRRDLDGAGEQDAAEAASRLTTAVGQLQAALAAGEWQPTSWWPEDGSGVPADFWALDWPLAGPTRSDRPAGNSPLAPAELIPHRHRSFSAMLDACYAAWLGRDAHRTLTEGLERVVRGHLDRLVKKSERQAEAVAGADRAETWQVWGELLLAQPQRARPGESKVTVANYYDPSGGEVEIPLDPRLTLVQNAQQYFKRYQKARRTEKAARAEWEKTRAEIEYLEGVAEAIRQAGDDVAAGTAALLEIREELGAEGYAPVKTGDSGRLRPDGSRRVVPRGRSKPEPDLAAGPRRFRSPDGFSILVGRNNRQNDALTLRLARPDDLWLHCKEIPGSHVIIRTEGTAPPESTVLAAAGLAAYYSRARQSSSVPVDYTLCRHVRKPRGARPGMVIYDHHRTVFVTPAAEALPEAEEAVGTAVE